MAENATWRQMVNNARQDRWSRPRVVRHVDNGSPSECWQCRRPFQGSATRDTETNHYYCADAGPSSGPAPAFVFDGEIVALDRDGRPIFNDLLFGRRQPVYVTFDVLVVDGEDVRDAPLKERKALLEKVVRRHRMQKSEPVLGDGQAAFQAACGLDLEGVVAKGLGDSYGPRTTREESSATSLCGASRAATRIGH
jgi:hypothetical protein